MRRWKRNTLIVLSVVLAIPVTLFVIYILFDYLPERARAARFHDENITQLASVATYEDAVAAVGNLDVVLGSSEGPWVVIAYRDTHRNMIASSAVALTSDGRWLESTEHFCGTFSGYSQQRQSYKDPIYSEIAAENGDSLESTFPELYAIDQATDIDTVIDQLVGLGFDSFTPASP